MRPLPRTIPAVVCAGALAVSLLAASTLPSHGSPEPTSPTVSDGIIRYVEPPRPAPPLGPRAQQKALPQLSEAEVFSLASKPDSSKTIFLDFDGHVFSGTAWNDPHPGSMPLADGYHAPPFDMHDDPGTFDPVERAVIHEVWQRVAEDYAPFDVNVTTADPGSAGLVRSGPGDQTYGVRALVAGGTEMAALVCGGVCVGIAYGGAETGVFDLIDQATFGGTDEYYRTSLNFADLLGNDPIQIAETISHEVGHNLGLDHDGWGASHYYLGHSYHGPGGARWSPIMGKGNGAITQFSKGEYAGATETQDDLAVIASNGLDLRSDDHEDEPDSATPLTSAVDNTGVVESAADVDVFSLTHTCTGPLAVAAVPAPVGPNLDIKMTVAGPGVNEEINPLSASASAYVATGMDAEWTDTAAAPGVYTFAVQGTDRGTPDTGYSDYGSIGQYTITATSGCAPATAPDPVANLTTTSTPPAPPPPRPRVVPKAPKVLKPKPGKRGRPLTVLARWQPRANGTHPIRRYRVTAIRVNKKGRLTRQRFTRVVKGGKRKVQVRVRKGRYVVRVVAVSAAGRSPAGQHRRAVRAR